MWSEIFSFTILNSTILFIFSCNQVLISRRWLRLLIIIANVIVYIVIFLAQKRY